MELTRRDIIKSATVAFCVLEAKSNAQGTILNDGSVRERYDSIKSLQDELGLSAKWWNIQFNRNDFVVCLQKFHTFGHSREHVHAWRQIEGTKLMLVWSLRSEGIGPLNVVLDETRGSITVKTVGASQHGDFVLVKDSIVGFFLLAASKK